MKVSLWGSGSCNGGLASSEALLSASCMGAAIWVCQDCQHTIACTWPWICRPPCAYARPGLLQVLLACIKCPGSQLLTNQNLIDIFQACFRIGHYQGDSSKGMQGNSIFCLYRCGRALGFCLYQSLCGHLCSRRLAYTSNIWFWQQQASSRPSLAAADETVSMLKILQHASDAVPAEAASALTDACHCRLKWTVTVDPCCAELLTEASRQAMIDMVTRIFSGLSDLPPGPLPEPAATPRLQLSGRAAEAPGTAL